MEGQVILAGDFNQVMDGMTDKSKPSGKSFPRDRAAIQMLAEDLSLVDIWRLMILVRENTLSVLTARSQFQD